MRRGLAVVLVALLGCTATNADSAIPSATNPGETTTSAPPRSSVPAMVSSTTSTSTEPEGPGPFIVVMPEGLPVDFQDRVADLDDVTASAVIRSGQMQLTGSADPAGDPIDEPAPGFVIPIEATVFETASAAAIFSPELAEALAGLRADEVLLSRSSAALRRLTVGGTMAFAADEFRVAAVVDDAIAGTTEAVFIDSESDALPSTRRRAAVLTYDGEAERLEAALMTRFDEPVRVFDRRGGEGRGDRQRVTLPQLVVKQLFGEFAYRPRPGGRVEIDPSWTEANLVTVDIPLLGQIRCHRVYADLLAEVMAGLVADGLEDVIDPGAYQGCWNPRFIAGSTRLSRHSWGIAADINFGNALDAGPGSPVNEELLTRMVAAGTTSGHLWTIPDPGHFEYVGTP